MNIVICDDDSRSAIYCKNYIRNLSEKMKFEASVDIVESGEKLLLFIDSKYSKVDLIYMDIHLPKKSGIDTAKELRKNGILSDIVFYTVDETKAISGYDVDALHYIVKGRTSILKFDEILLKAFKRSEKRHVEILSLSCAGIHKNLPLNDILYFSVQNRITTVYYYEENNVNSFEFYSSLSKIDEFLFGKGFVRIHGSFLVSKRYVRQRTSKEIEMSNGAVLPVGRTYTSAVKSWK